MDQMDQDYDEDMILRECMEVDLKISLQETKKCNYVWTNDNHCSPMCFTYEFIKELFQAFPPGNPSIPEGYQIWTCRIGKTDVKKSDMIPFFDEFVFLPSHNTDQPTDVYHMTKFKTYSLNSINYDKIRDSNALFKYLFVRAESIIHNDREFYDMYFKYLQNKGPLNIMFGNQIIELPYGDQIIISTYKDGSTYNQHGEIVTGISLNVIKIADQYYIHYISEYLPRLELFYKMNITLDNWKNDEFIEFAEYLLSIDVFPYKARMKLHKLRDGFSYFINTERNYEMIHVFPQYGEILRTLYTKLKEHNVPVNDDDPEFFKKLMDGRMNVNDFIYF
jgi:hypothetical protein